MHEVEITNRSAEALGVELDLERKCTRLTNKRYWRLRKGLQYVLKMRRLDGATLEVIVGHCTAAGLVAREVLSVFHSCYAFIRAHYQERVVVWQSVREELQAFYGLMPLLHADWDRRWSEQVTCYDASESAAGVVEGFWPRDV
eukprot:11095880-Karenia_brevis.AAC.1